MTSSSSVVPPMFAPSLKRRLACMLYESLLLFGVVFVCGLIFLIPMQKHEAWPVRSLLQGWLFVAVGAYFLFFWHRGGQTLAMKTWHIRLVSKEGGIVEPARALLRYLLAWMWFFPALAIDSLLELTHWASVGVVAAGIAFWLATARLDPQRQFLHDRLAGTQLIDCRASGPAAA